MDFSQDCFFLKSKARYHATQNTQSARDLLRQIKISEISEDMIEDCLNKIPIEVNREYIKEFILNGQQIAIDILTADGVSEDNYHCSST